VNARLLWVAETCGRLTDLQCGFRRRRSAVDLLVNLEGHLQTAFAKKQHTLGIFIDLEKTYDTTWRFLILRSFREWGLRGYLPRFVPAFMQNRRFAVRVGGAQSSFHVQETGVPQGSVLHVTLFAIAINSIVSVVRTPVRCSLFVDDFAIYCSSSNLATAERQLQLTVDRLEMWAAETGFRFSPPKTVSVHFCRKRGLFPDPAIKLYGEAIPVEPSVRFLGLTLDSRLSWQQHILNLKQRCLKALNIMKCLSGTSWGADRTVLLRVYRAVVRSKLDYGAMVYSSARPSTIRSLGSVHHAGIRIATGAFRTSPVESLWAEAGEPPLSLRREYLLASYAAKISSMPRHFVYDQMLHPDNRVYAHKPNATRPAGIRLQDILAKFNLNFSTRAALYVTSDATLARSFYSLRVGADQV